MQGLAHRFDAELAGDKVYGMVGGLAGLQGTLAEYVAVDAELIALKPRSAKVYTTVNLNKLKWQVPMALYKH